MPINVYAVLGPLVLGLVVLEFCYCIVKKNGYYTFQDSISSLGTAIANQCMNLLVAFLVIGGFTWLYQNVRIFTIPSSATHYVLCFFIVDFLFYWFHRAGHSFKFLWAAHMPHHSTEELNYAVALRASLTQRIMSFLFYWPLVVIGYSPVLVAEVVAFHLVLQFIPHTRVIPKLPFWIEGWLNTASHHRVHHGLNKQYLDKNFAGFLIIWDKLFGTFEEEKQEVFYGVTKPSRAWDPGAINFQVWKVLWQQMLQTPRLWDKFRLWFMPLSWVPPGVKLPKKTVWTKENQIKYVSVAFKNSSPYIIFQLILALAMMFFIISDNSPLGPWERTFASLLLWYSAKTWAGLMESKAWVFGVEVSRVVVTTIFLLYSFNLYSLEIYRIPVILAAGVSLIWVLAFLWWPQAQLLRGPLPLRKAD